MSQSAPPRLRASEVEAACLSVLLNAETARQGGEALLRLMAGHFEDDRSTALVIRDRDGRSLQVLAETGSSRDWPDSIDFFPDAGARFALDPDTRTVLMPMRAGGRVVGAFLTESGADPISSAGFEDLAQTVDLAAVVLDHLLRRTESAILQQAGALRSLDSIIDGMAHQIANPLAGASAVAQLLAEEVRDDEARASAGLILRELSRALAVVQHALEFKRDTQAQDGLLDFGELVDRVVRFRGYAIREQGITLDLERPPALLPVRADARAVEHALLIFIKYAELQSHGTINRAISVRVFQRQDADVAVDITDSGPGALPQMRPGYLDLPFGFPAPAPERADGIPDLGLARSLIAASRGRVEVRASKTDGTTITVILPRAKDSVSKASLLKPVLVS